MSTLSAKPWLVTQRDTDRGQLVVAGPDTGQTGYPRGSDPERKGGPHEHRFKIAHVSMDIAAVGTQVKDRVADDLPWAVVGDIAAPGRVVQLDTHRLQYRPRHPKVREALPGAHTDGHNVGMLQQKQEVGKPPGATVRDQRLLELNSLGVRHAAQPAYFEAELAFHNRQANSSMTANYRRLSSNASRCRLRVLMKRSATAPSITR